MAGPSPGHSSRSARWPTACSTSWPACWTLGTPRLTLDFSRRRAAHERHRREPALDRRRHRPNARRREAGAQAVKVEGGVRTARVIEALVRAGIPVQGHIGWTPQAKYAMGGKVRVQGKTADRARSVIADALAVQEAGAFSMVLELIPAQLAAAITERLRIPTIGIGAGPGCSGQVQVVTDLLGLGSFIPRHA